MNKVNPVPLFPYTSRPETRNFVRFFSSRLFIAAFLVGLGLPHPVRAENENKIAYEVSFSGLKDEALKNLLREVSETAALKDNPPLTVGLLKKRAQDDIPRIRKALRSRGYYGAEIKTEIKTEVHPAQVVFRIETGPIYTLKKVKIKMTVPPGQKEPKLPGLKKLGVEPGRPAEARAVLDARSAILRDLKNQGLPLAKAGQPEVIVDHQDKTLSVTYNVDSGPPGSFGDTTIEGAASVASSFILKQLPWKPGDLFRAELLDKARANLLKTRLFNMVRFEPGNHLNPQGRLPLTLHLTERQPRTLELGLGYTTDEGGLAKADWEHRNIFHHGESLKLLGQASGIGLTLEGDFEKPDFLRPDQSFSFNLKLADEFPEAYTSRNLTGLAQVKRDLGQGLNLALGLALTFSDIRQLGESQTYELISLPVSFNRDRRDDILDPARGGNLGLKAAPYHDFIGGETSFYKATAQYSHYFKIISDPRVIFALRGTLGFMGGAGLEGIPADIRFYAGGGGSIRGYAYQSVGPLAGNNEPVGGRSLAILSAEIRIKITESIGLVPFLDGGNVFDSEYPSFDRKLLWGAGLGLRYFTPVGPLRLDLAFPLDRRETDNVFQIYISLGQAF